MGKVIDTNLGLSLERSTFWSHMYNVLNDLNHIDSFSADNDDEAVKIFREDYKVSQKGEK